MNESNQEFTDKFCDVLRVVAENGCLGPKEIIKCGHYIGEEHQILAWKKLKEKYEMDMARDVRCEGPCVKFEKDVDLCSTTQAKSKYGLDENDLFPLPYKNVYVRIARQHFPFFKTSDVMATMYEKYGKYYVTRKTEEKKNKELRKVSLQDERNTFVETSIDDASRSLLSMDKKHISDFKDAVRKTQFVKEYRSNGKRKRDTKKFIDTFFENVKILSEKIPISKITSSMVESTIDNSKFVRHDKMMTHILESHNRREELERRLGEFGLELRSDSTVCHEYINNDWGDLDDVVETMREMHFFFTHTRYQHIIRKEYDKIYRQKEKNRYYYGYDYSDDDSDGHDRGAISSECKERAMHSFCQKLSHSINESIVNQKDDNNKNNKNDKKRKIIIPKNILSMMSDIDRNLVDKCVRKGNNKSFVEI